MHTSIKKRAIARIRKTLPAITAPEISIFLKGSMWLLAGNFLSKAIMLAASVWIARHLGKESYGEYALLQNTLNMFSEMGGLGGGLALTRLIALRKNRNNNDCGQVITLNIYITGITSLILATLFAVCPRYIANQLGNPNLSDITFLLGLNIVPSAFIGLMIGALSGLERFRTIAKASIIQSFAFSLFQAIGAQSGTLKGVVLGALCSSVLMLAYYYLEVKSALVADSIELQWKNAWKEWKTLLENNLPMFSSAFMVVPITWYANLLLTQQPSGFQELAAFNAANQIKLVLLFAPTTLASVLLPAIVRLNSSNKGGDKMMLKANLALNAGLVGTLGLALWPLAGFILSFYGHTFIENTSVLRCNLILAFITAINMVLGTAITGKGRIWLGLGLNTTWATCFLLSAHLLVPRYLSLGLAISYLFAITIQAILQYLIVYLYAKEIPSKS